MYSCGPVQNVFRLRETPVSGSKEAKRQLRTQVAWPRIIIYFSLHRAKFGAKRWKLSGNGKFSHKTSSWLFHSQAHGLTHPIPTHEPSISSQLLCFPSLSLNVTQPSSSFCLCLVFPSEMPIYQPMPIVSISVWLQRYLLQKGSPNAISRKFTLPRYLIPQHSYSCSTFPHI